MRESISYAFVLNIVILFIFVCMAVVMGIFSYYRAFKAGVIIVDAIEKYEGYNCLSAEEIDKKLAGISYNVPFSAICNRRRDGSSCMIDPSGQNYAVFSYNLDGPSIGEGIYVPIVKYRNDDPDFSNMNSKFVSDKDYIYYTKSYQYGVSTYMYVDFPVVSSFLKLTIYSKTRVMHEFRQLYSEEIKNTKTGKNEKRIYDYRLLPNDYGIISQKGFSDWHKFFSDRYGDASVGIYTDFFASYGSGEHNARLAYLLDPGHDGLNSFTKDYQTVNGFFNYKCGTKVDFSQY